MKTLDSFELKEFYNNYNIEIITINGEAYACNNNSWNGQYWSDCWQLNADFKVINHCSIMDISVFDEDGELIKLEYKLI